MWRCHKQIDHRSTVRPLQCPSPLACLCPRWGWWIHLHVRSLRRVHVLLYPLGAVRTLIVPRACRDVSQKWQCNLGNIRQPNLLRRRSMINNISLNWLESCWCYCCLSNSKNLRSQKRKRCLRKDAISLIPLALLTQNVVLRSKQANHVTTAAKCRLTEVRCPESNTNKCCEKRTDSIHHRSP